MFFNAKEMTVRLGETIKQTFFNIPGAIGDDYNILAILSQGTERYLWMILPIMLVLCVVAILANYLQSGFILSVDPLTPKASKIDPIKGLGKLLE